MLIITKPKTMIYAKLLFALFSLSLGTELQAQQMEYCNNRFNFCIHYPESLVSQERSINADGITLSTADGQIQVCITGSHNVMDWPAERIYSFEKEAFAEGVSNDSEVQELEFTLEDDGFRAILSKGKQVEAMRMWGQDEVYVMLSIKGPSLSKQEIETIWQQIAVKF